MIEVAAKVLKDDGDLDHAMELLTHISSNGSPKSTICDS